MKKIATICILTLCLLRAYGQAIHQDSLFFLERKTLEFGKNLQKWTGKLNTWENSSFVYRLSTGLQTAPLENEPVQLAWQMEGAYKWHFIELGVRYSANAVPFGTNAAVLASVGTTGSPTPSDNIIYGYATPTYTGMSGRHALATVHFPLAKLPMFVRLGVGRQLINNDNPSTVLAYMEDGSRRWLKLGSAQTPPTRLSSFFWGIGVSKGPLFGSFEWMQMRLPDGTFPGFRPEPLRMQQIQVGLQLAADKKGVHSEWKALDQRYAPRKIHLGVAYTAHLVANRHSVLADGMEISLAAYVHPHWTLGLHWQLYSRGMGRQRQTPEVEDLIRQNGFIELTNPVGTLRKTLLSAQWTRYPQQTFTWTLHGGLGWYRIGERQFDNWVEPFPGPVVNPIQHRAGIHAGVGVQYRYLHSRLVVHDVWHQGLPVFIEWNTGMRLSFFR